MNSARMNAGLREIVLLVAGAGLVLAGLLARPRDPATIGIGTSLLLATPAMATRSRDDRDDTTTPDEASTG